ncbi:MAG TPA: Asp-tRNA(Asn)/Glu-tRNA(Gln) amidotransferase subunit GatC [Candidatus Hydrogenedentes bacterium]|nr:Asp-tRNA(Asn)/Glu-tRNA(Gln) amidotransferase subunit GatC [Candidatus Hydrogenedentota bacterium]HOJ69813.1 Asp-tRNA(Asn)/Glu-tRNA(Gln) amidotransferase subunit GatC [Candidatus Hydrogenedentota bacterium]HOK89975.1 Asp-tRNA(Asn)/Glu-tRNA(Gln) amidotransferase subunit GatC [Candidatus Hydrogenedentota bacterium]HOV59788.1 Asp-tRNA(Asn)/Glu-tRNA(Gln) amidotransferase subunit GatC [Candidatus Hydrogenedentota bacterium]
MEKITKETVAYIAALAHLRLTPEETERMTRDLGDILGYMDQLNELDTTQVEPMMHALEMTNVFREDEIGTPLDRDQALHNAPSHDGQYFLVPRILEGDTA